MKERKKEDQRNSPLSFFFLKYVYLGYQLPQKKIKESRISSLGGGGDKNTQKKGDFPRLLGWRASTPLKTRHKTTPLGKKTTNENTKKETPTSAQIWWGAETPPARRSRSVYATSRFPRGRRIRARDHFGGRLARRVLSFDRRTTRERCARRVSHFLDFYGNSHMTHVSPAPPPTFAFREMCNLARKAATTTTTRASIARTRRTTRAREKNLRDSFSPASLDSFGSRARARARDFFSARTRRDETTFQEKEGREKEVKFLLDRRNPTMRECIRCALEDPTRCHANAKNSNSPFHSTIFTAQNVGDIVEYRDASSSKTSSTTVGIVTSSWRRQKA